MSTANSIGGASGKSASSPPTFSDAANRVQSRISGGRPTGTPNPIPKPPAEKYPPAVRRAIGALRQSFSNLSEYNNASLRGRSVWYPLNAHMLDVNRGKVIAERYPRFFASVRVRLPSGRIVVGKNAAIHVLNQAIALGRQIRTRRNPTSNDQLGKTHKWFDNLTNQDLGRIGAIFGTLKQIFDRAKNYYG